MTWGDALIIAVAVVFGAVCLFAGMYFMYSVARRREIERDEARRLTEHYFKRWGGLRDQLALLPYRDPKTGRMQSRSRSDGA